QRFVTFITGFEVCIQCLLDTPNLLQALPLFLEISLVLCFLVLSRAPRRFDATFEYSAFPDIGSFFKVSPFIANWTDFGIALAKLGQALPFLFERLLQRRLIDPAESLALLDEVADLDVQCDDLAGSGQLERHNLPRVDQETNSLYRDGYLSCDTPQKRYQY